MQSDRRLQGKAGLAALRVDMIHMQDPEKRLLVEYGGRALPYVLLIDPQGKVQQAFTGMFSAGTLTEALVQLGRADYKSAI